MQTKKRNMSADVIRCFALFCVVSVHFLLNNGYYTRPVEGARMFAMTLMRSFFIVCVPLFITLSGYLLRKRELNCKYYTRVFKIIVTYILCSLLCMLHSVVFLEETLTVKDVLLKLLGFTGAPYAWYIEMYLGLFLIIPFLNILYNNIPSRKWKQALLATFIILTALPTVVNVYDFSSASWWLLPSALEGKTKLIPAWWSEVYPITYYFIGCYLGEYGFKMKKPLNIGLIALCTGASGIYTFWRSYKGKFIWGDWCDYNSLFNIILTVLVFVFLININYDKVPKWMSVFIQKLSGLCLGAYLLSWIFDKMLYAVLEIHVTSVTRRLEYYFLIVPAVFVLSLMLSYLVSKIQLFFNWIFSKITSPFRKKKIKNEVKEEALR